MVTSFAVVEQIRPARRFVPARMLGLLWSGLLLALLAFLVLYPTFMLLYGALSGTNPVVDGFDVSAISLRNFAEVLANPNVHYALINTLVAAQAPRLRGRSGWALPGSWYAPTRPARR